LENLPKKLGQADDAIKGCIVCTMFEKSVNRFFQTDCAPINGSEKSSPPTNIFARGDEYFAASGPRWI
jgi:hypothetical protein